MQNNIINIFKVFAIVGVLISALAAILLIWDFSASQEIKESLQKGVLVAGTLAITSIAVIFIAKLGKKD